MYVSAVVTPLMHQNSLLTLQGAGAYDAAVHCASVSAARRIQSHRGDTPTQAGSSLRPFDAQHPFTPRAVSVPALLTQYVSSSQRLLPAHGQQGCELDRRL